MTIDLVGLKIGHATDEKYHTGCTVFLCPENTVASADVRGPAAGSRELALLSVDKPKDYIHALVFTGGSAFGLATADGVMRFLAERGIGHVTPIRRIPLVPAAVVYDLFLGGGKRLPDAAMGYEACLNASADNFLQGNVGAGTGVSVGKWSGPTGAMKGGFGLASQKIDDLIVGAAVVVNAIGDVVNEDGTVLAGARDEQGDWWYEKDPLRRFGVPPASLLSTNTTLVLVFTNALITKVEANRLAQRAHDGLAIAIRPVHTTHDGDVAFALATGKLETNFDLLANTAVLVVAKAIRNAVRQARSVASLPGLKDMIN